jgi:transposase
MSYVKGLGRKQNILLPDCIEDLVGQDNPVLVIDAFVDGLDMDAIGFQRAIYKDTGRPGYDPRDLLKLYVYGF